MTRAWSSKSSQSLAWLIISKSSNGGGKGYRCRCFRRCEEAFPIFVHSIKAKRNRYLQVCESISEKRRILLVLLWSHQHEKNREGLVYQDPPCIHLKENSSLETHSVHATSWSTGTLLFDVSDCTVSCEEQSTDTCCVL